MSRLSKELAKQAAKHGICEEWRSELRSQSDIDAMLDMYIKGIDFCLSNEYPTNDFIRKNFKGKMEHKGIHLDEKASIENDKKAVLLGDCDVMFTAKEYSVCEVFVKHNSKVRVSATDNSFTVIDMFDNSSVYVHANGNAKVRINRYGGHLDFVEDENAIVKVVDKNSKKYE